jgi:hypothetical protein
MTATKTDQANGEFDVVSGRIYWRGNENHEHDPSPYYPPVYDSPRPGALADFLQTLGFAAMLPVFVIPIMLAWICALVALGLESATKPDPPDPPDQDDPKNPDEDIIPRYNDDFVNKTTDRGNGHYIVENGEILQEGVDIFFEYCRYRTDWKLEPNPEPPQPLRKRIFNILSTIGVISAAVLTTICGMLLWIALALAINKSMQGFMVAILFIILLLTASYYIPRLYVLIKIKLSRKRV